MTKRGTMRWMRRWMSWWMMVDNPPHPWRSSGPPHIDARQFGWNLGVWRSQIATWPTSRLVWDQGSLSSCSIKWQNASHKQNTLAGETFIHIRKLLVVSDCYAQLLDDTDYNGRRWRFQMLMEFKEKIPWMEVKGGFTLIDRVNDRRWNHKLLNHPTPISLSHCPCMRKNPNKQI